MSGSKDVKNQGDVTTEGETELDRIFKDMAEIPPGHKAVSECLRKTWHSNCGSASLQRQNEGHSGRQILQHKVWKI